MFRTTSLRTALLVLGLSTVIGANEVVLYKARNAILRNTTIDNTAATEAKAAGLLSMPPPALRTTMTRSISPATLVPKPLSVPRSVPNDLKAVFSDQDLTLPNYLQMLISESTDVRNGDYDAKIDLLQNALAQTRYDFDVSIQGYLGANQLPTATEGMGTGYYGRIGLHAKKNLYDGSRHYFMNEQQTLVERLSQYRKISAQENVKLYGIEMYLQLLELQTRGEYLKKHRELTEKLYQNAMQKYEKGVNDNAYNPINAEMDKLALEKLTITFAYDMHKATIAFKQAAGITDDQKYSLHWPENGYHEKSLELLQQKAIESNYQIGLADTLFRYKKGEIVSEKGNNDWKVNFDSFAGVGYSSTSTNLTTSTSQGLNWSIGLQAAYPLTRQSTDLAVEKRTVEALREKNNLLQTQRNVILRVNTLYAECEQASKMLQLLSVQKQLAERQLKIAQFRYEGGLEIYSVYASSMKKLLEIEENILSEKSRQARNLFELQLLTGGLDR